MCTMASCHPQFNLLRKDPNQIRLYRHAGIITMPSLKQSGDMDEVLILALEGCVAQEVWQRQKVGSKRGVGRNRVQVLPRGRGGIGSLVPHRVESEDGQCLGVGGAVGFYKAKRVERIKCQVHSKFKPVCVCEIQWKFTEFQRLYLIQIQSVMGGARDGAFQSKFSFVADYFR